MKKINVGILGFGKVGKIRYEQLKKFKNVNIVCVYDKDVKILSKQYPKILFSKTINNFFSKNIDAVIISTFTNSLAKYTKICLRKNIHVFCEKPPAVNYKELLKIKPLLKKSKSKLKYGFNHRYHSSVIEAKSLIQKKNFGKLLWIRGIYGKAGSVDYNKNWRNFKKISGGGILLDQGIHMLDLILFFSKSEIQKIYSLLTTSFWKIKPEDNAFLIMKNKKGIVSFLHSSATQWKHTFKLELYFAKGYIILEGLNTPTGSYTPETIIFAKRSSENIKKNMGKPKETKMVFKKDNSWFLELKEFINAIIFNKKILHGAYLDAVNVMKLINKIYNSKRYKWS